jgi:hypothetical protein
MMLRCEQRLSWCFEKMDALMLSFASDERAACFWAFYYEENVSRERVFF